MFSIGLGIAAGVKTALTIGGALLGGAFVGVVGKEIVDDHNNGSSSSSSKKNENKEKEEKKIPLEVLRAMDIVKSYADSLKEEASAEAESPKE